MRSFKSNENIHKKENFPPFTADTWPFPFLIELYKQIEKVSGHKFT